ncbi:MAG: hypothetical protein HUJ88_02045 [Fusobacterium necrophorum]|nr:hypothetical protein [Fusobacterium necrophorum]
MRGQQVIEMLLFIFLGNKLCKQFNINISIDLLAFGYYFLLLFSWAIKEFI